jgi:hypothetical protein
MTLQDIKMTPIETVLLAVYLWIAILGGVITTAYAVIEDIPILILKLIIAEMAFAFIPVGYVLTKELLRKRNDT